MTSLTLPPSSYAYPSYRPYSNTYSNTRSCAKSRTIEVTLGSDKSKHSRTFSQEFPEYTPQIRSKILAYLATTNRPFPLSIRNSDRSLHHQDISDLRQLLCLSGEDRWWEIDLDSVYCEKCIKQSFKSHGRSTLLDKIPVVADVARQITTCLCDSTCILNKPTSRLIECPHETTFSKLMRDIDHETRCRLSCLRVIGSFRNPLQVASAIHNILRLFPNIQQAEVRLPPATQGCIPDPERVAHHLATLESSLPKGIALRIQNILEHQDFLLKWVQVKRKWYQLIPNETEIAQLNKIRNLSDSEEKLMGVGSESINWARLNRGIRFN